MNNQSQIILLLISLLLTAGTYLSFQNPNSEQNLNQQDLDYGQEINITYESKEGYQVNLHGRLVIPPNALFLLAKKHLAIIVPDAGQTDLNCNNPQNLSQLNTNAYLQLAQQLEMQGIATFRYNKRSISPSSTTQPESKLTFDDLAEDLNQIVLHLKKLNKFNELIILGHGEGSGVAMQTITKYLKNNEIQGFISLNGPGQNGKYILQNILQQELPFNLHNSLNQFLNQVQQGKATKCPKDLQEYQFCNPQTGVLRQSNLNYLTSQFQFQPTKTFSEMTFIENLIVQGERDIQVPEANALLLQSANESTANNTYFSKMNHILKNSNEDRSENLSTFTDPELPLTESLSEILGKFILGVSSQ